MTKTIYNIDKLQRTGEINAKEAVKNFASVRAYSSAYDAFMAGSPKHLQYLPDIIVYVDVTRSLFIEEVLVIQKALRRLGMDITAEMLDDLVEVTNKGVSKAVSDRLVQYRAKLELYKKAADDSRTVTNEKPVILTVDDMPEILTMITDSLTPDYDVIAVTSAKDAEKAAEMHIPDLFLFDIEMPEEDGVTLATDLRKNLFFAHTPLFFLTSTSKKEYVKKAKELGSKGYILKPLDKATLIKRISPILK